VHKTTQKVAFKLLLHTFKTKHLIPKYFFLNYSILYINKEQKLSAEK